MTLHSWALLLLAAAPVMFGQFNIGIFGPVKDGPKAGDLAPDITFDKLLHAPDSSPWVASNLDGIITALVCFPYVSGNPQLVAEWNALVDKFADKPVQFLRVAKEDEATLLPFLKDHPVKGWWFNDLSGATGQAYGLEMPQPVLIGADRKILGFDGPMLPSEASITGALESRITNTPPEAGFAAFREFAASGKALLQAQPNRMPRPEDHRPNLPPSYAAHISAAKDPLNGGDYRGSDYWNLQGFTLPQILAEVAAVNAARLDLPEGLDRRKRYDVAVVLPKAESPDEFRRLLRDAVEKEFHISMSRENRLRDVYVLTASETKKLPAAKDAFGGGGGFSSTTELVSIAAGDLEDFVPTGAGVSVDQMGSIGLGASTVEEFSQFLERALDRPVVNETGLDGLFDFEVQGRPELDAKDFVARLRDQLGLVVIAAKRDVETTVFRSR